MNIHGEYISNILRHARNTDHPVVTRFFCIQSPQGQPTLKRTRATNIRNVFPNLNFISQFKSSFQQFLESARISPHSSLKHLDSKFQDNHDKFVNYFLEFLIE